MIHKLEINAVHTEVDAKLKRYVHAKIGKLDKYMNKHSIASAHAEVILKEAKAKDKKQCICEVILHLPHDTIAVKEATINMYAAIDIVEAKLKNQLKKYKETHDNPRFHQRLITKFRRTPVVDID